MHRVFASLILLTVSGCSSKALEADLKECKATLKVIAELSNSQEYLLQTAMLNANGPMTIHTLGAYHGLTALISCESEAQKAAIQTKLRWWCVRGNQK